MTTEEPAKERSPIDEAALTRMLRVSGAVLLVASASTIHAAALGRATSDATPCSSDTACCSRSPRTSAACA